MEMRQCIRHVNADRDVAQKQHFALGLAGRRENRHFAGASYEECGENNVLHGDAGSKSFISYIAGKLAAANG